MVFNRKHIAVGWKGEEDKVKDTGTWWREDDTRVEDVVLEYFWHENLSISIVNYCA